MTVTVSSAGAEMGLPSTIARIPSAGGPRASGPVVLLVGWSAEQAEELAAIPSAPPAVVCSEAEGLAWLESRPVVLVCIGPQLPGAEARRFLDACRHRGHLCRIVLAAGAEAYLFQDLVDEDQIFYLSARLPPLADVAQLLASVVRQHADAAGVDGATPGPPAALDQRLLDVVCELLGEAGEERVPERVEPVVRHLGEAERASCLLFDPEDQVLWTRDRGAREARRHSAAAGLASFVLRTGVPLACDRVGDDPRYDPETDNEGGSGDDRFLGVPVASPDPGEMGPVLAVLVALRPASGPPFGPRERARLESFARRLSVPLASLRLQRQLERRQAHRAGGGERPDLYRREALEHAALVSGDHGHPLQLSPRWTRAAYPFLMSVFAAAALFGLLGSVQEHASGRAVVRAGRTELTVRAPATVEGLEVEPGQRVGAGQLLVRLYGREEAAELDGLRHHFERELIERLRNPADPATEGSLGALRARKQLAEARLEERSIRAPHEGVVSDVRVRAGQHLAPGDVVLSLVDGGQQLSIVALLPGHYRPHLRPGLSLRLELDGHPYSYQELTVDRLGGEVVDPAEARRVLGTSVDDAVPLAGPLVLVYARLPGARFTSDGETYEYHGGMQGTAEVRVRSQRLLTYLLPALKPLFGEIHG